MNIKQSTTVEIIGYINKGKLRTHPCDVGEWWGNTTCDDIDITETIEKIGIADGEYKITITLEKIPE